MLLFQLFSRLRGEPELRKLAETIAARSQDEVWRRVRRQAPTMTSAETRGYIRSRAAAVIHHQVRIALANRPRLASGARPRLIELAVERVIHLVSIRLATVQCSGAPQRSAA